MRKPSLLVIGMLDSPHLEKWVSAVDSADYFRKIWLFPSTSITKFGIEKNSKVKFVIPLSGIKISKLIFRGCDLVLGLNWRRIPLLLAVKFLSPDVIHVHEIQHAGYIFSGMPSWGIPKDCKVFCSTWGSDLIVYGRLNSEKEKIDRALSRVDVLLTERTEDEAIARSHNFNGKCVSPMYATIGLSPSEENGNQTSRRRCILLKGYQDNHGRALNALRCLELVKKDLSEYEIYIFSASPSVRIQAELLALKYDWNLKCLPKIPHAEMADYYLNSRITLSLGISDGISNSMVESMQAGAFPIQSENSCASNFLEDGVSGFIVNPWDLQSIARCIDSALSDDNLVDSAAEINRKKLQKDFNLDEGLNKLLALYSAELTQIDSKNDK